MTLNYFALKYLPYVLILGDIVKAFRQSGFWFVIIAIFFIPLSVNASVPNPDLTRKRMINDLEFVKNVFEVKYAPKDWKESHLNWDLDLEIDTAKSKILSLQNPSTKDFQIILKHFFNSSKDYHASVKFYSTESAQLPFIVKRAEKKYFITYIDRLKLPMNVFPFQVGDEIITFDNQPIDDVIQKIKLQEFGSNTPETDQALSELKLTYRQGESGDIVPKGPVSLTIKNKVGKLASCKMNWEYTPEKIRDYSNIGRKLTTQAALNKQQTIASLLKSDLFNKFMVHPVSIHQQNNNFNLINDDVDNCHLVGSRKSYIPSLGRKIWESKSDFSFHAYIYQNDDNKRIGYIRIPHYMADEVEAEHFLQLMAYFQKQTDALVIDQINNPGGSVFYLYALASMLTDKPLYTPRHRLALTQEEVYSAVSLLPVLDMIRDDATARSILGDNLAGYPVNYEVIRLMIGFCNFVIDEWNQGNTFTKPFYIFGVDEVNPHPEHRYTKPILILVNSLDFSGGDFFPAIMQDNKRAKIMGTRTAGAGGYVLATEFPNQNGIKEFHLTGSIAERINQKPIENLGVIPDIQYELTKRDLQNNYSDYVQAIQSAVNELIK